MAILEDRTIMRNDLQKRFCSNKVHGRKIVKLFIVDIVNAISRWFVVLAKDLKALWRHFVEEWNKGKTACMAVIDETCATNFVFHESTGEDIHGLKDFKKSMSEFFTAFPDNHITIGDMVVEGDKVAARYTLTGTHKGEFMGIPPTNKKVTMWAIEIDRIVGGKFVEGWIRFDTLGFMQQLGVIPKSGK